MKRLQSKKWKWIKPVLLLPVLALLALAFAKPRVTVSESPAGPALLAATVPVFPVLVPQDVQDKVDQKKIEDYKKKIALLKEKYIELEEKKKAEGDAEAIEEEQKRIKKKVTAINAELEKMLGPDIKKKEEFKKQLEMTKAEEKKQQQLKQEEQKQQKLEQLEKTKIEEKKKQLEQMEKQ